LKRCKSPGSNQIPAELIQAGGEILCSKIHKLTVASLKQNKGRKENEGVIRDASSLWGG
jgi:hypothetical protein